SCHCREASATSVTAPTVRQARKLMIATTTVSARPATERSGTMGGITCSALAPGRSERNRAARPFSTEPAARRGAAWRCFLAGRLIIDLEMAVIQHQTPRVELVHESDVMGGDHHRGAQPVQLDEEPEEPAGEGGIDIAGRLVGNE